MKKLVDIDYLIDGKRRRGLLTVTESRIGDPYLFRHVHRSLSEVERDLRYAVVVEKVAEKVGLLHVLKEGAPVALDQQILVFIVFDHLFLL